MLLRNSTKAFGLLVFLGAACAFTSRMATAAVVGDVSVAELSGMTQLYALPIPSSYNFTQGGVPYSVNNTGTTLAGTVTRVAYYLELQKNGVGQPREWVWVSMDAFSNDPTKLGVPSAGTGIVHTGTIVNNLHVESSKPALVGTFATGDIEFWASNYNANGGGALGSHDTYYDWKDSNGTTVAGHGSMQVHYYDTATPTNSMTFFGFNRFNGSGGMGIGNENVPLTGNTDWTFGPHAYDYTVRSLEVWTDGAVALSGLNQIVNGGFEYSADGWWVESGTVNPATGYSTSTPPLTPHSGSRFMALQNGNTDANTATISQLVATHVGATYEFSFWYNVLDYGASADPDHRISYVVGPSATPNLADTIVVDDYYGSGAITHGWVQVVERFIATESLTRIAFTGDHSIQNGWWGPQLDDVSLVMLSVPEPSSLAMLVGLGAAGVLAALWRRRRKVD